MLCVHVKDVNPIVYLPMRNELKLGYLTRSIISELHSYSHSAHQMRHKTVLWADGAKIVNY